VNEFVKLKKENDILRNRIENLENEIEFLVLHPTIAQGLKGERFICDLTEGTLTKPQASHDITLENQITLEVKFSSLVKQGSGESYRWHWGKPLGQNMKKDYDFLLLVGDKDYRYDQYLDNAPFVFFLLPLNKVKYISASDRTYRGGQLNLNTHFATVRSPRGKELIQYMVSSSKIKELTSGAHKD